MFTAIVQVWIIGTCLALSAIAIRDWRLMRRHAIEQGKRDAAQAQAACRARTNGIAAAAVGSLMTERKLRPAPGGRWSSTERNSLRGVPPRLGYVRTPAEDLAIKAGIILSTSISMAECRERQRIQGSN